MVCVHCSGKTQVVNSRSQKRANQVWRRRKCLSCGAIFSTEESTQYTSPWVVDNGQGILSPFNRDKLFLSLLLSFQHRKSAIDDAGALTDTIMRRLVDHVKDGVLHSRSISQIVQVALSRFDTAASVHYDAFHQG